MRTALFIVGPPAAGKTTIVRALLGPLKDLGIVRIPKWTVSSRSRAPIVAAGHYHGDIFDGADRVGYNQVMPTLEFWAKTWLQPDLITIFDGDRFSYAKALEFVLAHSDRVVCVSVRVSLEEQARRIAERGWNPNPTWLQGRRTKARRFFGLFKDEDRLATNELEAVTKLLQG